MVKQKLYVLVGWIIVQSTFCQRTINTEITPQHVRTKGTNLYLVPPDGFFATQEPKGFASASISLGIIVHGFKTLVDVILAEMTNKQLKGQGAELISEEPVSVNGLKGYFLKSRQYSGNGTRLKYTLIFQDPIYTETHMVQCYFPEKEKKIGQALEQAIFTIVYKAEVETVNLPFTLQYEKYGFAHWKTEQSTAYYKAMDKDANELTLVCNQFLVKGNTDSELIFYNKMKQMSYFSARLDSTGIEQIQLDGLPGWHATITARDASGQPKFVYQVLVTNGNLFFLLQGTCPTREGLSKLRQVASTFRKKN
jgi:hypothetical protein